MKQSTLNFHRALIRLAKGALTSWGEWVDEQMQEVLVDNLKQRRKDLPSQHLDNPDERA